MLAEQARNLAWRKDQVSAAMRARRVKAAKTKAKARISKAARVKAAKGSDIKLLFGMEGYLVNDVDGDGAGQDPKTLPSYHIILIAKNNVQYISGVPNMFYKMFEAENFDNPGLENLTVLYSGGDIVNESFSLAWSARYARSRTLRLTRIALLSRRYLLTSPIIIGTA